MLYLIGLGLNKEGISKQGINAIEKCSKIYLENYTVNFPYPEKELEEVIGKKIISIGRDAVETDQLVNEAKKEDICLLIYGSPLTATTHISLIEEAKKSKVKYEIIYNSSVFDAIAETGLQIYKFGKITSMPKWTKSFKPTSFMEIVKENKTIDAHSLILIDIGLELEDCLNELKEAVKEYELKLDKIILCSGLGTKESKIFYKSVEELKKLDVKKPYCIILPSKLHFIEKEVLQQLE
jgi:diphthine methyl ester synthase